LTQAPPENPAENPNLHPSRREVRKHRPKTSPAVLATPAVSGAKKKRKSSFLSLAVMAVVVPGLFATVALPAYAFAPAGDESDRDASVALEELKETEAQTVVVDAGADVSAVARDAFTATTETELAASRKRSVLAATYASYSGPKYTDFLANPPYPNFDLNQVVAVGQQYLGTPYVYGGADPSGFDCSGFIMFVYSQFGISLPHSVSGQAARGSKIAVADALPGDIVIMSGHDGIYMGNGNIMDAPRAGGVVSVRPIWTDAYYIVRIGV
jgi:cell wall-associated NlpC family hydrolase